MQCCASWPVHGVYVHLAMSLTRGVQAQFELDLQTHRLHLQTQFEQDLSATLASFHEEKQLHDHFELELKNSLAAWNAEKEQHLVETAATASAHRYALTSTLLSQSSL